MIRSSTDLSPLLPMLSEFSLPGSFLQELVLQSYPDPQGFKTVSNYGHSVIGVMMVMVVVMMEVMMKMTTMKTMIRVMMRNMIEMR